mmetsp:Transcript_29984/g.67251  ORF Transcript_29984/g.67251 Transcript_29984/m.67251 type:complete len:245 (-) Transcript_29984:1507-2241(-)
MTTKELLESRPAFAEPSPPTPTGKFPSAKRMRPALFKCPRLINRPRSLPYFPSRLAEGSGGASQPCEGLGLVLEEGRDPLPDVGVVGVHPSHLVGREHALIDERLLDGNVREPLELEEPFDGLGLLALARHRGWDHFEQVLDPHPELSREVIPGLVAQDHARLERVGVSVPRGDARGPLMHVQCGPHPVARAVPVVEPAAPEALSREHVEHEARGALGEHRRVHRDVALQHPGEAGPLHVRRRA